MPNKSTAPRLLAQPRGGTRKVLAMPSHLSMLPENPAVSPRTSPDLDPDAGYRFPDLNAWAGLKALSTDELLATYNRLCIPEIWSQTAPQLVDDRVCIAAELALRGVLWPAP